MGTCCATREKVIDRELDLPDPVIQGNVYQKFELFFPFGCTWIDVFEKRVRKVEKDGGVTLEDLRTTLTTKAWCEIKDEKKGPKNSHGIALDHRTQTSTGTVPAHYGPSYWAQYWPSTGTWAQFCPSTGPNTGTVLAQ